MTDGTVYRFLDCELDLALGELRRNGELVDLQAQPFRLLVYLIEHRGALVTKDELLNELWQEVTVSESAITSALRDVRRAVGNSTIKTLRGRGYRFAPSLREVRTDTGPRTASGPGSFVGRDQIIDEIEGARAASRNGSGRVVLISGEPGIGKTRLLEEFLSHCKLANVPVHSAWCDNAPETPPYWPWIQILRALSVGLAPDDIFEKLGPDFRDLMALLGGDLETQIQAGDQSSHPDLASFALSDKLSRVLQKTAKKEPLVLCLDDLHFADSASLRLLVFLAHELATSNILIVATYRQSGVQYGKPIAHTLAELARLDLCHRVELKGLEGDETRSLVSSLTAQEPSPELVNEILEKTDGNPFFIHELVRYFSAQPNPQDWLRSEKLEVPPGLHGVLRGRLGALSNDSIDILAVAATAGRDVAVPTISRALGASRDAVAAALEEASAAGIIRKAGPDRYRFAHTLVRETLYFDQSPRVRASLHRQLGEALEAADGSSPGGILELARHFGQAAGAGNAAKAFAYAEKAGKRAAELMAFDEAADHFGRALELKEAADSTHRCELLLELSTVRDRSGYRSEARASYQEASRIARRLGDARLLARSAEGFAGRPALPSVDQTAVELLEEALEAQEFADTEDRVRILVRLAGHLFSSQTFERAEALVREALGRAERLKDPSILASVLDLYSWLLWVRGEPGQREQIADRCFELADRAEDDVTAVHALLHRSRALLEEGRIADSDRIGELVRDRVRQKRLVGLEHFVESYRAMRLLLRGDFAESEKASVKAHAMARKVDYAGRDHAFAARMGLIRSSQGRIDEMASMADQIVSANPDVPGWRCALSLFFAELGHRDEAIAIVDELAGDDFRDLIHDPEWLISANLLAETSALLGYDRHAQLLYEILLPVENRTCVMGSVQLTYTSTARSLGLLAELMGETSKGIDHLERACNRHAAMEASPLLAQSQVEWARNLFSRGTTGDRRKGDELIAAAGGEAKRLGMPKLLSRCQEIVSSRPRR